MKIKKKLLISEEIFLNIFYDNKVGIIINVFTRFHCIIRYKYNKMTNKKDYLLGYKRMKSIEFGILCLNDC